MLETFISRAQSGLCSHLPTLHTPPQWIKTSGPPRRNRSATADSFSSFTRVQSRQTFNRLYGLQNGRAVGNARTTFQPIIEVPPKIQIFPKTDLFTILTHTPAQIPALASRHAYVQPQTTLHIPVCPSSSLRFHRTVVICHRLDFRYDQSVEQMND